MPTCQEGRDHALPFISLGCRGPSFSQFNFLLFLSVAIVAHNTRHRWFGNKRNRRHWSLPWHKCRTVSCDMAHWLPGSCLLAALFPSTEPVRACMLVLYPFSAKVTFPPFSLLLREQRWVTHSQPEWGLRRSAPFAVFNEEIEAAAISFMVPTFFCPPKDLFMVSTWKCRKLI